MSTLTVTGRSDVAGVSADVDRVAASVRGLGDDVERVDDAARQSGGGLDALGESSDNVSSKSSQAAGAMGDLAGGLDLIGASGAADALGTFAIGAQVAAGAGDVLNLVAETSAGRFIASAAATVGHTVATTAQTVATGAMTAAQTAFNAVMAANPVALVVIAVVALAAGLVVAYQKSETFRDIVDGAFGKAKAAVEAVVDAVSDVIDWFGRLPENARQAWGDVKDAVEDKVDDAIDKVGDLVSAVVDGPRDVATTVAGYFSSMFAPILDAIGWVQDLIDKIGDIDFPDLNPLNRSSTTPTPEGKQEFLQQLADANLLGTAPITLTLNAKKQDEDEAMRTLVEGLRDYFARQGFTLSITEEN